VDPHRNMKGFSLCPTNQEKALIDATSWSRLSARQLRSPPTPLLKLPPEKILHHEERSIPGTRSTEKGHQRAQH